VPDVRSFRRILESSDYSDLEKDLVWWELTLSLESLVEHIRSLAAWLFGVAREERRVTRHPGYSDSSRPQEVKGSRLFSALRNLGDSVVLLNGRVAQSRSLAEPTVVARISGLMAAVLRIAVSLDPKEETTRGESWRLLHLERLERLAVGLSR
jgi:hypothetical protein